jgi:hypothetical protein
MQTNAGSFALTSARGLLSKLFEKRKDVVRHLQNAGFEGPFFGGKP